MGADATNPKTATTEQVLTEGVQINVSRAAVKHGGGKGGAYLDSLKKGYDLTKLSPEEFDYFCTLIVFHALHKASDDALSAFITRLERIVSDEIPF